MSCLATILVNTNVNILKMLTIFHLQCGLFSPILNTFDILMMPKGVGKTVTRELFRNGDGCKRAVQKATKQTGRRGGEERRKVRGQGRWFKPCKERMKLHFQVAMVYISAVHLLTFLISDQLPVITKNKALTYSLAWNCSSCLTETALLVVEAWAEEHVRVEAVTRSQTTFQRRSLKYFPRTRLV